MALRRQPWLALRLHTFSPPRVLLAAGFRAPPTQSRRRLVDRRHLTTSTRDQSEFDGRAEFEGSEDLFRPDQQTGLARLLRAIRRNDNGEILPAFLKWTSLLTVLPNGDVEENSGYQKLRDAEDDTVSQELRDAAKDQLGKLPESLFSEIVRSIDPVLNPSLDVTYGLTLSTGVGSFTYLGTLVNDLGTRITRADIAEALKGLFQARVEASMYPLPDDYVSCFRAMGAASAYHESKQFWRLMGMELRLRARHTGAWTEFIKARFFVEPAYYQFNRSRVALSPRHLPQTRKDQLMRMENNRHSINAQKISPHNRRRQLTLQQDMMMILRKRKGYRSYTSHWQRAKGAGRVFDEELLCSSMIAWSRAGSMGRINELVFRHHYGIDISNVHFDKEPEITGGDDFPPSSPVKPTQRLLDAIVEAYGNMGQIVMAAKLLDFVSRRYELQVPYETWSKLLGWTFLHSSKPYNQMLKIRRVPGTVRLSADHVLDLWKLMTSEPYNVRPGFPDCFIYVKTLLSRYKWWEALLAVRGILMPFYRAACQEHELAVADEMLQADAGVDSSFSSAARHRRERAAVLKSYTHWAISYSVVKLVKAISERRSLRLQCYKDMFPDLVTEFAEFFHQTVDYKVRTGVVRLDREGQDLTNRLDFVPSTRSLLDDTRLVFDPATGEVQSTSAAADTDEVNEDASDVYVTPVAWAGRQFFDQGVPDPQGRHDFPFAATEEVPPMEIRYKHRQPVMRLKDMPRVSPLRGDGTAWDELEKELVL